MDEFLVQTPMGDIVVTKSLDFNHPGVYIDIRRPGCDCDAPLALIEYSEEESDLDGPAIITRTWDDARCEEFGTRIVHGGINEYFDMESNKKEAVL